MELKKVQDYYEKLEDMSNLLDVEGTYIGEVEAIKIKNVRVQQKR